MKSTIMIAACAAALASPVFAQGTPSPEGARIYFVAPGNDATVQGPVSVGFGLSGMGVAPAGIEKENTGHHHLLIDRPPFGAGPDDADMVESGVLAD